MDWTDWVILAPLFVALLLCVAESLEGILSFRAKDGRESEWMKAHPISRKTRFKQYVAGERQLMADWEEAFGGERIADIVRQNHLMPINPNLPPRHLNDWIFTYADMLDVKPKTKKKEWCSVSKAYAGRCTWEGEEDVFDHCVSLYRRGEKRELKRWCGDSW